MLRLYSTALPGFSLGSVAGMLTFTALLGVQLHTGLGVVADIILGFLAGALMTAICGSCVVLARLFLTTVPWWFSAWNLGALAVCSGILTLAWMPPLASLFTGTAILAVSGGLGAGIAILHQVRSRGKDRALLVAALICTLAATGVAVGTLVWLMKPGMDPQFERILTDREGTAVVSPAPLAAPDPGKPGSFIVKTLFYGSGTDLRRPEFGLNVSLRTLPVDASLLLKDQARLGTQIRRWYWGFGKENFPLNGRVWFPEGVGRFPLVLLVHGNHTAQCFSDPGYAYLGDLLASRGFICVSVDENFLNSSWECGIQNELAARAWILLKHLEVWREWNRTAGNPFFGKVDMGGIALVGHSRGGEAAFIAATLNHQPLYPEEASLKFNFGFPIRSVVAIAPTDGQASPLDQTLVLENTDYFVIHGSHDADVPHAEASRPYQRVRFTDGQSHFKASLYVGRANHSQFNTSWGKFDEPMPLGWLLRAGATLDGEDQRRIAKVFISGFLEASLHGRTDYLPMFRDPRQALHWLPKTHFINQFKDSTFTAITQFAACQDLTRTTLPGGRQEGRNLTGWRHGPIKGQEGHRAPGTTALMLGWDTEQPSTHTAQVPSYSIILPKPFSRPLASEHATHLVFSMTDLRGTPDSPWREGRSPVPEGCPEGRARDPIDLTIELVAIDGTASRIPLSWIRPVQPTLRVRYTKLQAVDQAMFGPSCQPVFQTFEIPFLLFKKAAPGWDGSGLARIRFVFDRTPKGAVAMQEVGFSSGNALAGGLPAQPRPPLARVQ